MFQRHPAHHPVQRRCLLGLLALTLLGLAGSAPRSEGVDWQQISVDEAIEQGALDGKRVFIKFTASWCGPCKKLDQEVLETDDGARLTDGMIAVKVDVDASDNREYVKRYQGGRLPTVLVLKSRDEEVGRIVGYSGRDQWLEQAKQRFGQGRKDDNDGMPSF